MKASQWTSLTLFTLLNVFFSSCSQSGKPHVNSEEFRKNLPRAKDDKPGTPNRNVVKMRKRDGVYEIPTEINGQPMFFIFDTGAGMISISKTEAVFLYKQGTLTDDDVVGNAKFVDANGDISDKLVVKIKSVKIGNQTLNDIEASIVPNMTAPLLFGQSALEKFGKVSIDYIHNEIVFE